MHIVDTFSGTYAPRDRLILIGVLFAGVVYAGWQALSQDWAEVALMLGSIFVLTLFSASRRLRDAVIGEPFTRRHAVYIIFFWAHSVAWLNVMRLLAGRPWTGKDSTLTYTLLIAALALGWMMTRSLLTLTRPFHRRFITAIPIWEQFLVAANEVIAAGLLAFFGANTLVRLLQPQVFTTRFDALYTLALGSVIVLYYVGMQFMWVQRLNDLLSQNHVWVRLARLFAPLLLLVGVLVIRRRFIARADPRTADLLGDGELNLAVLALAPVIVLVIVVLLYLIYTGGRGLRQRFLPDLLLDRLPARIGRVLRSVSDMDMLLILALLLTSIPAYIFLLGDAGGVIGALRAAILQRGSALIETSEQALALLFAMPFYALIVLLLALYALVISRSALPAAEREEIVRSLPIGFLIVLIITLYLFAVPFSQVVTEGRLPQLPQDLVRILAFNIVIPLVLLYAHYFVLVRIPYRRGQTAWREHQAGRLNEQLDVIDRQIEALNRELALLDRAWQTGRAGADQTRQLESLYRYVQLNSRRDDLNMQRLQVVAERQGLTELSETPISVTVARLPVRVVSVGIPLLLAIQLYQWAVVNNGLREIVNNPNVTVVDFFRTLLSQLQF